MKLRPGDMFGPKSDLYDPSDSTTGLDRELVIWLDESSDTVALLHIVKDKLPRLCSLSAITFQVQCLDIVVEDSSRLTRPWATRSITDSARKARDHRVEIIRPLINNVPAIFDPSGRGRLIGRRHLETGVARSTIKCWMHLWYRHGRCLNALLDRHDLSGRRGQRPAQKDWSKLGRPADPERGEAHANVTAAIKREFQIALNRERKIAGEAFSISSAYRRWLNEFCFDIAEDETGRHRATLKVDYEAVRPASYKQFWRWYDSTNQTEVTARRILGNAIYEKDHRALTSTSTAETSGPGSRFQIDATIVNYNLASSFDPQFNIGRPYLYFVRDVWSRYIVGYYLGFIAPSWVAAALALANAFCSKESLLRRFDFDPVEFPWVSHHVCGALLHDGGELKDKRADYLVGELAIDFEQASGERGDLKGAVESLFQWFDVRWASYIEGRRPSLDYRGRHRDDQLAAKQKLMTVKEFEREVVGGILQFNNKHVLTGYDPDPDMVAARVPRIPLQMWNWGVKNRGRPRSHDDEYINFRMFPHAQARVTPEGILYRNLYFLCPELAVLQQKAASGKSAQVTISHDLTSERVYWHSSVSPTGYYVCHLSDRCRSMAGLRFEEISGHEDTMKRIEREYRYEEERAAAEAAAQARANAERLERSGIPRQPLTKAESKRAQAGARALERRAEMSRRSALHSNFGEQQSKPVEERSPPKGASISSRPSGGGSIRPSLKDVEDAED